MFPQNVMEFLGRARSDGALAEQIKQADTYDALAGLSQQAGRQATAADLEAAFVARNARELVQQMIHGGLMEPADLPSPQPRNWVVWEAVQSLDLQPIVTQMINRKGWTPDRVAAAVRRYRGFLYLSVARVTTSFVPTPEVDEIWHQHILNTRKYAVDCQRLAGEFIHHNPSSGSQEESEQMHDPFLQTWVAYETQFNEPYPETIGAALLQRWPAVAAT